MFYLLAIVTHWVYCGLIGLRDNPIAITERSETMNAIKYHELDCQTFADALRGKVDVVEVEDLTGKVPHVGFGGAVKSKYISPKSGKTIYVLEQSGMYAADAFVNRVWQFEEDFSVDDAIEFLRIYEKEKI